MPIYDITLPLHARLACWPGDAPYETQQTSRIAEGASVNLSAFAMSAHMGTHVDAPYHFREEGETTEALPLDVYVGPARVVEVEGKSLIQIEDLCRLREHPIPRLLLKTSAWRDTSEFPETIPVLATDVPAYLRACGVKLLGLDIPSVDALDSKELPIHHALAENGIQILESLALADVPEGDYELIALPMKLVGADGAPVRAILRR